MFESKLNLGRLGKDKLVFRWETSVLFWSIGEVGIPEASWVNKDGMVDAASLMSLKNE